MKKKEALQSDRFNLRLSKSQKNAFRKLADKEGLVMSEYLRNKIDEYLAKK